MIVTGKPYLTNVLADLPDVAVVVSFIEPDAPAPALGTRVRQHVVLARLDIEFEVSEWVVRFGGSASDVFSDADADCLIAVGRGQVPLDEIVVHCSQGVSRSTAAAVVIAAASGLSPADAVEESRRGQLASFRWRPAESWLPNRRILRVSSERLYGDDRLVAAVEATCSEP